MKDLLRDCLKSLLAAGQATPDLIFEIIVVDSASADGSPTNQVYVDTEGKVRLGGVGGGGTRTVNIRSVDGLAVEMSGPIPDAIGDATVILNGSKRPLEVPCRAVYSRGSIGGVKLGLHVLDRTTLARWMAERR